MSEILMPQLSSSMEQGTILTWLKNTGEQVQSGEEILEIETDKSTVTYAAEEAGILKTLVDEGATVAVGMPIAQIGGVEVAVTPTPGAPAAAARMPIAAEGEALTAPRATPQPARSTAVHHESASTAHTGEDGPLATPLARRVAAANGIALREIKGTGRLGRITRVDVLTRAGISERDLPPLPKFGAGSAAPEPTSRAIAVEALMLPGSRLQQPSRLQQLIARRMTAAKTQIPHFQVQTEVKMDAAIALRSQFKALAAEREPVPSLNDLIIKAAALSLREHPLANASFHEQGFVLHEQINVGIAVAAGDALIVPTVFDAVSKSLGQIALQTRELARRAREGEISPSDLESGTFTVSNLGMFGMTAINPVVNPPQAAILGVGSLRQTLARSGSEIVDRTLMSLTLSCDHRILYGADAARFLARISELLETPLKLVL